MADDEALDMEDILSEALESLYDYRPITFGSLGSPFSLSIGQCPHRHTHSTSCRTPIDIILQIPDTDAAHWALHASSIWVSSMYLANHLNRLSLEIRLESSPESCNNLQILELGASAGLPSIAIAKIYSNHPRTSGAIHITATDYPDNRLIKTLSANVNRNEVSSVCRVLPYAWGTDPSPLFSRGAEEGFDLIIAADTVWNLELHEIFIYSLGSTLKKSTKSRVYLVVGLHTGRYTIQTFLDKVILAGFDVEDLSERESGGPGEREWVVSREDEDEKERRKWVIWIQLKWNRESIGTYIKNEM